jgi:hypothetical protein
VSDVCWVIGHLMAFVCEPYDTERSAGRLAHLEYDVSG